MKIRSVFQHNAEWKEIFLWGGMPVNNRKLISPDVDELFDAILSLKNRDECYMFFEDMATIQEVKALSLRLQIAKRLYYDNDTYPPYQTNTGYPPRRSAASTTASCMAAGDIKRYWTE